MASNKSSVIQLNDDQDVQSELQFQDFSLGESTSGVATLSPSDTFTSFPSPDSVNIESENLLGAEKKEESSSFWKFSYYQSFFDIETREFLERLKWSFIPLLGRATYLDRQIRPKADLYGPFWITFSLIYSTVIMTNIANYFNGAALHRKEWSFNFHRVSLAATTIYAYVFILPIIIWGLLKHFQYSNRYTLLEIICVYGYSLAIFVPISIFWIFDAAWLHWILVITGIALTGAVLLHVFWPIFRDDNKKTGAVLLGIILICHVLLGIGFGTLFFQEKVNWVSTTTTLAPAPQPITNHPGPAHLASRSIEEKTKDVVPEHNVTKPNISPGSKETVANNETLPKKNDVNDSQSAKVNSVNSNVVASHKT